MKRKPLSLTRKLAATLLQMVRYDDHQAEFVRVIPYSEAKTLTDAQIIARFHFDHNIAHADGGSDEAWNLTPMPVADHRRKTALVDVPRIAKGKRISKAHDEFRRRLLAKDRGEPKPASKWPARKIHNRGFERRA